MEIQLKQDAMVGRTIRTHGQPRQKCTSARELEEVLLDIENTLNNRPLTYVEDDVEYPILTQNTLVIGQHLMLPDEDLETENKYLCKRFKYIRK